MSCVVFGSHAEAPQMIAPANPLGSHSPGLKVEFVLDIPKQLVIFSSLSTSLPPETLQKKTAQAPKNTSLVSILVPGLLGRCYLSFREVFVATLRASQIFIAFDVSGIHMHFNILIHSCFHSATTYCHYQPQKVPQPTVNIKIQIINFLKS